MDREKRMKALLRQAAKLPTYWTWGDLRRVHGGTLNAVMTRGLIWGAWVHGCIRRGGEEPQPVPVDYVYYLTDAGREHLAGT